jgi:pilus assembly protein Flp/PilA
MKIQVMRFWKEEDGQDIVEYALLLALVALGTVAAMNSLALAISNAFSNVETNLAGNTT